MLIRELGVNYFKTKTTNEFISIHFLHEEPKIKEWIIYCYSRNLSWRPKVMPTPCENWQHCQSADPRARYTSVTQTYKHASFKNTWARNVTNDVNIAVFLDVWRWLNDISTVKRYNKGYHSIVINLERDATNPVMNSINIQDNGTIAQVKRVNETQEGFRQHYGKMVQLPLRREIINKQNS